MVFGFGGAERPSEPRGADGTYYPATPVEGHKCLLAGIQHVFAMFGATVLGPLLMGFDPNTAILMSGLATLLFWGFLRKQVPSYLGSSFSFIAAVNAATYYTGQAGANALNERISIALGGIFAAGLLYFIVGFIVSRLGTGWLKKLMPPEVTGTIVAVIGLNLASTAVNEISGSGFDTTFGLLTIILVVLAAVTFKDAVDFLSPFRDPQKEQRPSFVQLLDRFKLTKGAYESFSFLAMIPILLGGGFAYLLYAWASNVAGLGGTPINISKIMSAAWVGGPHLVLPQFDIRAIGLIAPVAIVLVAENFGHIQAISTMTKRDMSGFVGKAFMVDAGATMASSLLGGTGVTTYAENMGVMNLTRNYSTDTFVVAGLIACFLGFSPKFGEAIHTIPTPILGGLSFILFGLITATAGRIWNEKGEDGHKVDFTHSGTLLSVGIPLVMGAGNLTWTFHIVGFGDLTFGGIATATFSALFLWHAIGKRRRPVAPLMRG